jgi:hypothetical protein
VEKQVAGEGPPGTCRMHKEKQMPMSKVMVDQS